MDFGLLPPEVNSGLMYAGTGPRSLIAASSAWNSLAAELHSVAASYSTLLADLREGWDGPSGQMMSTAVAPYIAWIESTALAAQHTATQLSASIAAYETAFAATVPPQVVAANRALHAELLATNNFLGVNTPAIMANEAQYDAMWAQDSAAMHAYAGTALTTTRLTPFTHPPKVTNDANSAMLVANAVQNAASVASAHSSGFASTATSAAATPSALPTEVLDGLNKVGGFVNHAWSGGFNKFFGDTLSWNDPFLYPGGYIGYYSASWLNAFNINGLVNNGFGVAKALEAPKLGTGIFGSLANLTHAHTVSASSGQAASVGSLSVPSSWSSPVPGAKLVSAGVPLHPVAMPDTSSVITASAGGENSLALFSQMAMSSMVGRAAGGQAVKVAVGKLPAKEELANATTATILVVPVDAE